MMVIPFLERTEKFEEGRVTNDSKKKSAKAAAILGICFFILLIYLKNDNVINKMVPCADTFI